MSTQELSYWDVDYDNFCVLETDGRGTRAGGTGGARPPEVAVVALDHRDF